METIVKPERAELAGRVADLVPLLREKAAWSEANQRLSDEVVEALTEAGVFRMRVASRFGGYESDAKTLFDVGYQLGQGDGAVGFNVAAWWITSWNVGLFPDEVQDEVFANPDTRVCGTLVVNGTAVPKDGGIVLNGEWAFNSGAAHSRWKLLSTILITPDGEPEPIMAIVPMADLRILDDWDVSGLRGTGSVTTVAENVFIPTIRYAPISAFTGEGFPSKLNADVPTFRTPLVGAVAASNGGKLIGMARAASDEFFARIGTRSIGTTMYDRQTDAPITHLQAAEASLKIDEAEFHARRLADMVDDKARAGESWTLEERAYARVVGGRIPQLVAEAVDQLAGACGAASIRTTEPIQRIRRNVRAITLHALHLPSTNLELYGRILCGLEPNTFFL